MQQGAPIGRHMALGAWDRLIDRMRARWRQCFTRHHDFFFVVVKPIFTGFEAGNDGMAAHSSMLKSVLGR